MSDTIRVFSVLAVCLVSFARCLPQATPPQGSVIHVEVVRLRNSKGRVFCALYASAEGFPKDSQKAIRRETSSISEKKRPANSPGSRQVLTRSRCSTMRIRTANWIRTSWEYLAKELGLRTMPEATWVPPNSMLPNSNFPEAGSTSRSRSTTCRGAL